MPGFVADDGFALGAQAGDQQGSARAQVGRSHVRTGQVRSALHDGDAVLHADVRAQTRELRSVHKTVFKDGLQEYAGAGRAAGDGHHRGLQVGGEAGVNHGADFKGLLGPAKYHEPARGIFDMYASLGELEEQGTQVIRPRAAQQQFAAGERAGAGHGAGLDAVGDGQVVCAVERGNALDDNGGRACAGDFCAHGQQKVRQIHDFRLLGGIFNARCALGERGGHHQVLRRADGRHVKVNRCAAQAAGERNAAVIKGRLGAKGAHALYVLVDGPLADGAAARQRDARLPKPCQQRPQHEHGSAHFAHVVVPLGQGECVGAHNQRVFFFGDGCAAGPHQRNQVLNVGQRRWALNPHVIAGQKRGAHDGKHRVFGRADRYLSPQRRAFAYRVVRHRDPSDWCCCRADAQRAARTVQWQNMRERRRVSAQPHEDFSPRRRPASSERKGAKARVFMICWKAARGPGSENECAKSRQSQRDIFVLPLDCKMKINVVL